MPARMQGVGMKYKYNILVRLNNMILCSGPWITTHTIPRNTPRPVFCA